MTPAPRTDRSSTAAYAQSVGKLLRSFETANSQFTPLVSGATIAEVASAAPVLASATATFEHGLVALHPPASIAARLPALETQLKLLSRELTVVADDAESGKPQEAAAALSVVRQADAKVTAIESSVG